MTSATTAATAASTTNRRLGRLYLLEAKLEFLKLLRLPVYSVAVLAFPLILYLLFGTFYGNFQAQGLRVATYLVATFGAGGVLSAAMYAFGVGVASERGQGWMLLKRVSPMPPLAYFVAKMVVALLFALMVVIVVSATGFIVHEVRIDALAWLKLTGVLLLGVFPFAGLGMAIGYMFGPNSAPVVINLIYMPMAFASGLWMPITILPEFVQNLAVYLPAYHYVQLALGTIGAQPLGSATTHVLVLAGYTILFLAIAVWAYWRDEGKTYG